MKSPLGRAVLLAPLLLLSSVRPSGAESPTQSGFEWWRLRPTDVSTTGSTGARSREPRNAEDAAGGAPGERRAVRVVYPGLISGR